MNISKSFLVRSDISSNIIHNSTAKSNMCYIQLFYSQSLNKFML